MFNIEITMVMSLVGDNASSSIVFYRYLYPDNYLSFLLYKGFHLGKIN